MVAGVADHGTRLYHARQRRLGGLPFAELTMHHGIPAVAQLSCLREVFLEDDEGAADTHEFVQQCFDGRAVAVEQHHALHRRQLVRQLGFELLLEVRQHEDREDQKHQELAHELADDDEQRHPRVVPAVVAAVAGGGERFAGPLQALHQRARHAFQVRHAQRVERAHEQHGGGQHGQQHQQAPGGALQAAEHDDRLLLGDRGLECSRLRGAPPASIGHGQARQR